MARPLCPWRGPLVVGYHHVVESFDGASGTALPGMVTTRATFERQLDCLGRHYEFVSLDELETCAGRHRGRPVAAVTFDDGYADVYETAWPVLRRKGIPAAVFVVTDHVSSGEPLLHDRLFHLLDAVRTWRRGDGGHLRTWLREAGVKDGRIVGLARLRTADTLARQILVSLPSRQVRSICDRLEAERPGLGARPDEWRLLSWEAVRTLHRAGITIGSHTRTHVRMPNEPEIRRQDEALASKRALEQALGCPVRHFAYPDGSFDGATLDAVATAGYERAYTTCWHRDGRRSNLTIPRLLLWEGSSNDLFGGVSPDVLRCQARGWLTGVAHCTRWEHAR